GPIGPTPNNGARFRPFGGHPNAALRPITTSEDMLRVARRFPIRYDMPAQRRRRIHLRKNEVPMTVADKDSWIGVQRSLTIAAIVACSIASAHAQTPGAAEAKDMVQLGSHDLQTRSAYQPVVREQGGRYILYVGHHGGTERAPKPVNPLTGVPEFNG